MSKIGTSQKAHVDNYRFGAHVVETSGHPIAALCIIVSTARFRLARTFYLSATALHDSLDYRSAISRSYYAMYHCFRSVSFLAFGGDDHQSHYDLPKHIPKDFPQRQLWENQLKNSRADRNDADYAIYLSTSRPLETISQQALLKTKEALAVCKSYLRQRGCKLK